MLMATTVAQAVVQALAFRVYTVVDFRFWATISSLLALGVITSIQYIEHWRSRQPNGVVLMFWLVYLTAHGVKMQSLVARRVYDHNLPYFVLFTVGLGLALLEFILEWLVQKAWSDYDALSDEDENVCPIVHATLFSRLWFSWASPMMRHGYKHYITMDEMWYMPHSESSEVCIDKLNRTWSDELTKKRPSMWIALLRAFGGRYYIAAIIKVFSDIVQFIQPQLLRLLIQFVESYRTDHPQPPIQGVAIAIAMFACAMTFNVLLNQYFVIAYQVGLNVRASVVSLVFKKSLRLSNEGRGMSSSGDINNRMSTDAERIYDFTVFGHQVWSTPFQILICMVSLYRLLGWSAFAGVGVMVLSLPLNGLIIRYSKKLQKQQMKIKDSRVTLISEVLSHMKNVKLYAWTTSFMSRLNHIRNDKELNSLRKIGATQAMANAIGQVTPIFVACATFAIFVLTQNRPLSTDLVFPALTLFNMLQFPLAMLPMVLTAYAEASNSIDRLIDYFRLPELQSEAVVHPDDDVKLGDEAVRVVDGRFAWSSKDEDTALDNISFSARKGELSCIVGRVGAGKSSFLQALLGDLHKVRGEVIVRGRVAYVSQTAWVMSASVRDNVVFGHRFDQDFYDLTLKACALTDDLKSLPDGDQTHVGEKGIQLSGGQRARLTLARAVYARADVYILDDVLSAVDQHVGRHIIDNVIGPDGILSTKTRILATNAIRVLMEANFIVLLQSGKIIERGTYEQIMAMKGEVANLVNTAMSEDQSSEQGEKHGSPNSSGSSDGSSTMYAGSNGLAESDIEEVHEGRPQLEPIKSADGTHRRYSTNTLRRASTASHRGRRGKLAEEEIDPRGREQKEGMMQGKVKWSVYKEYARASNVGAVFFYLICVVITLAVQLGSNLWLKSWSEDNDRTGSNSHIGRYIGIYAVFGIATALLVASQTIVLWIFCSIEASRKLHERMAHAIFRAPMTFFDTTPIGRILNRFANDMYRIDESLARNFNMMFNNFGKLVLTVIVISASTPMFLVAIVPVMYIYSYMQRYYLASSRELKRLDSVSKSPIYAHFSETLAGASTIRAYRQSHRFSLESEWRVDNNARAWFAGVAANRWLAVRLEGLGALILFGSALFAIISVTSGSGISPGLVGLAVSYALQVTSAVNWFIRQTVEVEGNIVAVERVLEYAELPSEAPEIISKNRPPTAWPSRGAISIRNYSTRYREGLDLVLKGINMDIKAREKIGVVGRTGAGKSSLTLALFRLIEATDGDIVIDGIRTGEIGLMDLRRRLSIIPQDSVMFKGTIRSNLDPTGVHDDTELWTALRESKDLCVACEN